MIIDFHTHILPASFKRRRAEICAKDSTFADLFGNPKAKIATATELIRSMDADGVDKSVILGFGWTDPDIARESNDYILDSAERHRGRLIPFCSVNPRWGDVARSELEHCISAGAVGIGELHFTSQRVNPAKDRQLGPLMRIAELHNLPVVIHSSEPVGHQYSGKGMAHPTEIANFIKRFPGVMTVAAHWGGGLPFYAHMPEVRQLLKPAYFDSAASPLLYDPGVFRTVISAVGSSKVLFGSDYPLVRAGRIAQEISARLGKKDSQAVLGGNALALLGLDRE